MRAARPPKRPLDSTFIAKRYLGQNFLVDQRVIERITDACDLSSDETILEIGPGQGALTRHLLPCVRQVIAVEADRQLALQLPLDLPDPGLVVHYADFLKFDISSFATPIKVVGNIPYNISTPIIERVLEHRRKFSAIYMTVQLEFAERLVARPRTKDYSSLTCYLNYFAKPEILFKISPRAFRPEPKIKSCFMKIVMRDASAVKVCDEELFLKVIRQGFLQRRKTLVNALGSLATKDQVGAALAAVGLKANVRVEELGLVEIGKIADQLAGAWSIERRA